VRSKPGKFEMANKGTIFLDEIAEMSTHLQASCCMSCRITVFAAGGGGEPGGDRRARAGGNERDVPEAMKTGTASVKIFITG